MKLKNEDINKIKNSLIKKEKVIEFNNYIKRISHDDYINLTATIEKINKKWFIVIKLQDNNQTLCELECKNYQDAIDNIEWALFN